MYKSKNFSALIGMEGFSEKMLADHFLLYEGYVKNVNSLLAANVAARGSPSAAPSPGWHSRFAFEFDGLRLHEYYFGNLARYGAAEVPTSVSHPLSEAFGTYADWARDFKATAAQRGAGWAVLYRDNHTGHLFNQWASEHHVGHLTGCTPLLVLDAWEHAYMLDYNLDRPAYVQAFFRNIDWQVVEERLTAAIESGRGAVVTR